MTVKQWRRVVNASILPHLLARIARYELLRTIADAIVLTQRGNAKARHSHRKRQIRKLHKLGNSLKSRLRCIPKSKCPALSY